MMIPKSATPRPENDGAVPPWSCEPTQTHR